LNLLCAKVLCLGSDDEDISIHFALKAMSALEADNHVSVDAGVKICHSMSFLRLVVLEGSSLAPGGVGIAVSMSPNRGGCLR
jgi:hypothetical protein